MAYTGKTAVVTGGTGAIGYATALHLLREGLSVRKKFSSAFQREFTPILFQNIALLDIFDNKDKIEALKREFRHANIILLVTDISKRDIIERTYKVIIERFKHIDIVVNCAGLLKESDIDLVINTNLVSSLRSQLLIVSLTVKSFDVLLTFRWASLTPRSPQ